MSKTLWGPSTDTKEFKMDPQGVYPVAPRSEVEETRSLIDQAFEDKLKNMVIL
jgi:hypothetical protein